MVVPDPETVVPDPVHPETTDGIFRYGPWEWAAPRDGEHFRRCSFCGSLNPDDLAAEEFWKADWADRKYGWPHKFYVDIVNRNPERVYLVGTTNSPRQGSKEDWVYTDDLTAEQQEILGPMNFGTESLWYLFGTREKHYGKFYTIHLKDPTIDPEVKDKIESQSGIRFEFKEGKIYWSGGV